MLVITSVVSRSAGLLRQKSFPVTVEFFSLYLGIPASAPTGVDRKAEETAVQKPRYF